MERFQGYSRMYIRVYDHLDKNILSRCVGETLCYTPRARNTNDLTFQIAWTVTRSGSSGVFHAVRFDSIKAQEESRFRTVSVLIDILFLPSRIFLEARTYVVREWICHMRIYVCTLLGYPWRNISMESTRYSLLLRLDRFDRIAKIISRKSTEFPINSFRLSFSFILFLIPRDSILSKMEISSGIWNFDEVWFATSNNNSHFQTCFFIEIPSKRPLLVLTDICSRIDSRKSKNWQVLRQVSKSLRRNWMFRASLPLPYCFFFSFCSSSFFFLYIVCCLPLDGLSADFFPPILLSVILKRKIVQKSHDLWIETW